MFPAGLDYARDHFAPNLSERFIPARKSRTRATFGQSAIQPANRICISTRHAAVFFLLPVVCPPISNLHCCCVTTNYTWTPVAKNHWNCKFRAIDRPEAVGTGRSSRCQTLLLQLTFAMRTRNQKTNEKTNQKTFLRFSIIFMVYRALWLVVSSWNLQFLRMLTLPRTTITFVEITLSIIKITMIITVISIHRCQRDKPLLQRMQREIRQNKKKDQFVRDSANDLRYWMQRCERCAKMYCRRRARKEGEFVAKVIGIRNEAIKRHVFLDDTLGYKN